MPKPNADDKMVRIYVTPYKTTITKDDLEFSQGDYNVELVIALGVDNQEHLDKALESHGKILHDATVITVSAGDQTSSLGGIDWHDANASSLSEMVAGLAEALKDDKKKSLVDAPIATALLTGIVAETERFSNQLTSSKSMTVAAQLMSAGADQQLIATELQTKPTVAEAPEENTEQPEVIDAPIEDNPQNSETIPKDEIEISHDKKETLAELDERIREKHEDDDEPETEATPEPVVEEVTEEVIAEPAPVSEDVEKTEVTENAYALDEDEIEPSLGGTLNATTEQAAEDAHREALSDQNKTILSHAYIGNETSQTSNPLQATPDGFPGTPQVAPGSVGINDVDDEAVHSAYALGDAETTPNQETASAFGGVSGEKIITPPNDAPVAPADFGLPLPPPLPDFSQQGALPPPPSLPPVFSVGPAALGESQPAPQPEILGDILAPEAPATPSVSAYSIEPTPPTTPETPSDPGQFKIPS